MIRSLISLLPALSFCLPALAGMPAGIKLGENEKDTHQKVVASDDFAPLNDRAKRRLEENFKLNAKIAGQQWFARFTFDRRSKMLSQLTFVSDKAMQPNQYDKLLKPFYLFTLGHLRQHFQLQEPVNTPEFGHAGGLKVEEVFPLHALPGEGIMLTTGLWKAKDGGIHLCFTVQPSSNSAMGSTYTTNTAGKMADWTDIPAFEGTDEGQAFLKERGLAAPAPTPVAKEDEEEDDDDLIEDEETPEEPAIKMASEDLPQVEQDLLNALILFNIGKSKEGLAKLITAAQANNARALYELGCAYNTGRHGLTPNPKNADNAFRKAAMAGFALALVRYGAEFPVALAELNFRAMDGNNMVKTAESAGASSPSQRFNYAIMLRYGYGVRKDVEKARGIMQELADGGDPVAARLLQEWGE